MVGVPDPALLPSPASVAAFSTASAMTPIATTTPTATRMLTSVDAPGFGVALGAAARGCIAPMPTPPFALPRSEYGPGLITGELPEHAGGPDAREREAWL